jgi:hypothetical protein
MDSDSIFSLFKQHIDVDDTLYDTYRDNRLVTVLYSVERFMMLHSTYSIRYTYNYAKVSDAITYKYFSNITAALRDVDILCDDNIADAIHVFGSQQLNNMIRAVLSMLESIEYYESCSIFIKILQKINVKSLQVTI